MLESEGSTFLGSPAVKSSLSSRVVFVECGGASYYNAIVSVVKTRRFNYIVCGVYGGFIVTVFHVHKCHLTS